MRSVCPVFESPRESELRKLQGPPNLGLQAWDELSTWTRALPPPHMGICTGVFLLLQLGKCDKGQQSRTPW